MPLDSQTKNYLDQIAAWNLPPLSARSPEVLRAGMEANYGNVSVREPVAHVEDRTIPGPASAIPVRIYTPEGNGSFPVLVFFHGGGFVLGTLETQDRTCRRLANGAGCVVVSVEYRLAPESPFPAPPEDCYAAVLWVAEHAAELHGDATCLALAGESTGGNLVAVVTQMIRDQGGPDLVFQLLIYPATDLTSQMLSKANNTLGIFPTVNDIDWFAGHYLNHQMDRFNVRVSPLLARDLSNLPPALILTAEYDLLRDGGELYGKRLREAGVPVIVRRYRGLIHGFFDQDLVVDEARKAVAETVQTLREALAAKEEHY